MGSTTLFVALSLLQQEPRQEGIYNPDIAWICRLVERDWCAFQPLLEHQHFLHVCELPTILSIGFEFVEVQAACHR